MTTHRHKPPLRFGDAELAPDKFAQVDAALDRQEPLDEEEQEQLVQEFERLQLEQTRTYRFVFGLVGLVLCGFFAWATWAQRSHPYEQMFTGELRAAVPSSAQVQAALFIQAVALAVTAVAMLHRLPRPGQREQGCMPSSLRQRLQLAVGLLGSAGCCVFWLLAHYRMVLLFGWELSPRWELLWVPLAPLAYATGAIWVVASLSSSAREVAAFRRYKYSHKQV